jgi:hypothetical protein
VLVIERFFKLALEWGPLSAKVECIVKICSRRLKILRSSCQARFQDIVFSGVFVKDARCIKLLYTFGLFRGFSGRLRLDLLDE